MLNYNSVLDIPVTDIQGEKYENLRELVEEDKKIYLFVNVASYCGLSNMNFK